MSTDPDIHDRNPPRNEAARLAAQVEANDWKWLMSSKQGRRVVWRLLGKAGVFQSSFTGNSETFFREGKRAMGLGMLADITEHAPDSYVLMLTEATAKAQA